MTALLEAPSSSPPRSAAAATEVFTPPERHRQAWRRTAERLRWPLGIYTTPVAILVLWEVASRLGLLPERVAPAPTAILQAGWELWQRGELLPSIEISLARAGAGLAIGLTEGQTRLWVILPVMLRNALPALSNNFISLFKDTSVAAAITVPELTFYARQINNNTFRVIEVWSVCSLMYVAVCYLIAAGLRVVERRLAIPH